MCIRDRPSIFSTEYYTASREIKDIIYHFIHLAPTSSTLHKYNYSLRTIQPNKKLLRLLSHTTSNTISISGWSLVPSHLTDRSQSHWWCNKNCFRVVRKLSSMVEDYTYNSCISNYHLIQEHVVNISTDVTSCPHSAFLRIMFYCCISFSAWAHQYYVSTFKTARYQLFIFY